MIECGCENWESFLDLTQLSEARWASSNELSSWYPDDQRDGDDGEDDIYEYGVEEEENWVGDDEEEFDRVDILMQKNNKTMMRIRMIIVLCWWRWKWWK